MAKSEIIDEWRHGRTCVFKLQVQLVFVTKYRRPVFTKRILNRLAAILRETCEQMGGELLEFNGEHDHLHLLVSYPPKTSLSNLAGKLKGKAAYHLRREFAPELKTKLWGAHLWSPSYCAVACGGAALAVIQSYIQAQATPE